VGGIIGGIIGSYITAHYFSSIMTNNRELSEAVSIKKNIVVLSKIKDGDIEKATDLIETFTDGHLITFSVPTAGSEEVRKITAKTLESAKVYRKEYPRTTRHKEIDEAVAKALAKVPEK
jgi:tRNA(Ser,Leu) C12 N-acetylase TAN1